MNKVKTLATAAMAVAGVAGTAGIAQAATPSTAGTHTTTKPAVKTFKAPTSPTSAFGCNQDVCISIIGNGQHVSYWYTYASTTLAYRTTHPDYWVAGFEVFTGRTMQGTRSFYSSLGLTNYNIAEPNVQVCNTWTGKIPGKPCETIK